MLKETIGGVMNTVGSFSYPIFIVNSILAVSHPENFLVSRFALSMSNLVLVVLTK